MRKVISMKRKILGVLMTVTAMFVLGTVGTFAATSVANIGSTGYATLEEAIEAVDNGETIILNERVDEELTINNNKNFTISLNGNTIGGQMKIDGTSSVTIEGSGTITGDIPQTAGATVLVMPNAKADISGVTIENTCPEGPEKAAYALVVYGKLNIRDAKVTSTEGGIGILNSAKVNIKNVDVNAVGNCIITAAAYSSTDMDVVIESGNFMVSGNTDMGMDKWASSAIYWASHGKLTINSGTFTSYDDAKGSAALFQKNGSVVVNDGEFYAKDGIKLENQVQDSTEVKFEMVDGNASGSRSGLYFKSNAGSKTTEYTVDIYGGKFSGGSEGAIHSSVKDETLLDMVVYGGEFDEAVDEKYLSEDTVVEEDENGNFVIHTHKIESVEAVEATCDEDGNIAYYICYGCGKLYRDAGGTDEITDPAEVIVKATGHDFVEGICTKCGAEDPNYGKPNPDEPGENPDDGNDTDINAPTDDDNKTEAEDNSPKTGDTAPIGILAGVLLLAGVGVIALKRRENRQ